MERRYWLPCLFIISASMYTMEETKITPTSFNEQAQSEANQAFQQWKKIACNNKIKKGLATFFIKVNQEGIKSLFDETTLQRANIINDRANQDLNWKQGLNIAQMFCRSQSNVGIGHNLLKSNSWKFALNYTKKQFDLNLKTPSEKEIEDGAFVSGGLPVMLAFLKNNQSIVVNDEQNYTSLGAMILFILRTKYSVIQDCSDSSMPYLTFCNNDTIQIPKKRFWLTNEKTEKLYVIRSSGQRCEIIPLFEDKEEEIDSDNDYYTSGYRLNSWCNVV